MDIIYGLSKRIYQFYGMSWNAWFLGLIFTTSSTNLKKEELKLRLEQSRKTPLETIPKIPTIEAHLKE